MAHRDFNERRSPTRYAEPGKNRFTTIIELTEKEEMVLLAGGKINYIKAMQEA